MKLLLENSLLIAPKGIEILKKNFLENQLQLLIAPVGIGKEFIQLRVTSYEFLNLKSKYRINDISR